MNLQIVPECYADTAFIEFLGFKNPNHKHGKGDVLGRMSGKYKNLMMIGLVDKDPHKSSPKELDKFKVIKTIDDITLLQNHENKGHYIISIHPAFERWILKIADESGISLSDFGLPTELKELKNKVTGNIVLDHSPDFKRFLTALREKNPLPFDTIQSWCQSVVDRKIIE